jgi:hypothetical protein
VFYVRRKHGKERGFKIPRHKSGRYYARAFAAGKEVWKSLKTSHFSVAQAKLAAFLKEHRERVSNGNDSGVDIRTVSRWLGHKDSGALAMKTYGHLRREHSIAQAQRELCTGRDKADRCYSVSGKRIDESKGRQGPAAETGGGRIVDGAHAD